MLTHHDADNVDSEFKRAASGRTSGAEPCRRPADNGSYLPFLTLKMSNPLGRSFDILYSNEKSIPAICKRLVWIVSNVYFQILNLINST